MNPRTPFHDKENRNMIRTATWLNANAAIGLNVAETPDYPGLSDLLKDMDRLGVAQAVVWNKSAIPHARGGNRRLLDAIQADATACGRIIPSLVVAPPMLYERGAMDDLVATLRGTGLRALRALPRSLGYDLSYLEPLLERVAEFNPVLLVSANEDVGGVLGLAKRFPGMPIVVTNAMWQQMGWLFDAMRRRVNIYAETSWIHTQGTVDLLVREFGVSRVIFGMGPRSHAGAAMAGLVQSGLSPDAICRVARDNMAELLGLPALDMRVQPISKAPDSMWNKLLRGERLGVPLIDAHSHLGPSSRWILEEGDTPRMMEQMLERMDRIGVEQTIVFPGSNPMADDVVKGNEFLETVTRSHHDRLKGMISFHPAYADALSAKLDEFFARGFFVGFKILCSYWNLPVTDAVFKPAWEYANRHRLPILFHTWDGAYDAPNRLTGIVKRYPEATFVLGHSGGGDIGRKEAETLALENSNVVLEWCGSFCGRRLWEDTIEVVGNRRIVFGTDAVYHSIDWELGRLLSLDVSDDVLAPILGENMRTILARRR